MNSWISFPERLDDQRIHTKRHEAERRIVRIQFAAKSPRQNVTVPKLSIKDLNLKNQRVFIRVDFNVPIKDGRVEDDTRIRATIPTIKYATEHGARVILASHLGRPKGQRVEKYSLRPVAEHLAQLLNQPVEFADDCVGRAADEKVSALKDGDVLLL